MGKQTRIIALEAELQPVGQQFGLATVWHLIIFRIQSRVQVIFCVRIFSNDLSCCINFRKQFREKCWETVPNTGIHSFMLLHLKEKEDSKIF